MSTMAVPSAAPGAPGGGGPPPAAIPPTPTPIAPDDKRPQEHVVVVTRVGGTTVISCETLGFKNLEYPYARLGDAEIEDTIRHARHVAPDVARDLQILVVDAREAR